MEWRLGASPDALGVERPKARRPARTNPSIDRGESVRVPVPPAPRRRDGRTAHTRRRRKVGYVQRRPRPRARASQTGRRALLPHSAPATGRGRRGGARSLGGCDVRVRRGDAAADATDARRPAGVRVRAAT